MNNPKIEFVKQKINSYGNSISSCLPSVFPLVFCFVLVNLAIYLKCKDLFKNPQLFAEDANVFFLEAFYGDFLAIFKKYCGYFVLYQRFFAYLGSLSPVSFVPEVYFFGRLLAILILVMRIVSKRSPFKNKILAALLTVLIPIDDEVFHGLVNSQWFLGLSLFVLIISSNPTTKFATIFDFFHLVVAGLTGPYILIFSPFIGLKAIIDRTKYAYSFLFVSGIICVMQVSNLSLTRLPEAKGGAAWSPVPHIVAHCFAFLFDGRFKYKPDFNGIIDGYKVYLLLLAAIFYCVVLVYSAYHKRFALFAIALIGPVIFALGLYLHKQNPIMLIHGGYRYRYLPTVCFFWIWLLIFEMKKRWAILPVVLMFFNLNQNWKYYQPKKIPNMKWEKHSKCIGVSYPCIVPCYPEGWVIPLEKPRE
jgi:hypothetical protein